MKLSFVLLLFLCGTTFSQKKDHQIIEVHHDPEIPVIDGVADEKCWDKAEWHPLDQLWLGNPYNAEDFEGRFKLSWFEGGLLLLVEIKDDILMDQHEDPLRLWWDDDCVEVFLDEDNSGGEHQYNHNAFAYHVALDYNVVDMNPNRKGHLYNDHIIVKRKTTGHTTVWETNISIYDDSFKEGQRNAPVKLQNGKEIGFALAYCDNDNSKERENFIGSVFVPGEDKNRGWIDADIFGTIKLVE